MAQAGMKLPALSVDNTSPLRKLEDGQYYISAYKGELTAPGVTENMAKIKAAFPGLHIGFYAVFAERIREAGFTDERLGDAVKYVIDNCIYPSPTIANFLAYDKRIKLFSYVDMLDKVHTGGAQVWEYYGKRKIDGVVYWYLLADDLNYKP